MQLERNEEAYETINKALEINKDDPTIYDALANYYRRNGKYEKALELFNHKEHKGGHKGTAKIFILYLYQS
jgi:pentatricopeptide repeat protein